MSRALSVRAHLERYLVRVLDLSDPNELTSCTRVAQPGRTTVTVTASIVPILKCLVSGYFAQAARISPDGTHWISARELTATGTASQGTVRLWVHPTSILFKQTPTWVIFHEVVETGQGKAYMREVTVIEPEWLEELAPHFFTTKK